MEKPPEKGDFLPLGGKPSSEPPQSFLCPITCEIMVDPVMDADGNTYERWAITRWLEKSQQSPITRMPIASRMLVPNRALKAIIDDWRKKNNVPVPSSRPRASTASVSLSNSGTSTGRPPRVHSGRSRTGFRVSTLNVVLVVGCGSVRKVAKLLNTIEENKRLVEGVQMVLVFSQRKNAMFACERDRNGRWHTGHRTNTHFGNVREIHLVDPNSSAAPAPAAMMHRSSSSSRRSRRRRHTTTEVNHARTDSDNGSSIKPGQRQLTNISPPVRRAPPASHKRSASGPATDGVLHQRSRSFRDFLTTVNPARRTISSNNLFSRTSASPTSFGHGRSKSTVGHMARRSGRSGHSAQKTIKSRSSAQDLVSAVFSPLPVRSRDAIPTPPPAPVIKPFSRRRTPPLVAELDSAATMHANRIRMNEAAARMAPPRDHNFALRRWLKTPVLIPEEDSTDLTDLSSYERSHSISMEVKKMSKKENPSKSDDEGYESPVAPFREQLTDEELAQAIQKLLSKGIPIWESGDVVRCTMLYLKFAREQADSSPEINRALGDSKFAVVDESDRCLGLRLRRAFDAVLARTLPQTSDDVDSARTPSPPPPPSRDPPPPPPPPIATYPGAHMLVRGLFATM